MATATMTLTGLYNFDDTLFENMIMPDGVDKDTVINVILQTSGEFETLYPNADFCKNIIGVISKKWNRTFTKWYDALQLEYDPIYNYDRFEKWEDNSSGNTSDSGKSNGNTVAKSQNDNLVTAFDRNTLVENERDTSESSGNDSNTYSNDGSHTDKSTHEGHLYGNIGVTTSQQMLESELDLAEWNLYEHIADIFVRELCIPVYG